MQKVADFVLISECSENRLFALQILQTAVVKVERDKIIRAVPYVQSLALCGSNLIQRRRPAFNTVAKVLIKELEAEYGDSAVIEQSEFLDIEYQTAQRS